MPRPPHCKWVRHEPRIRLFGPKDAPARGVIELPVEGLEAIRLFELEGLDQKEAARSMGVSRQTFGRVLARARANTRPKVWRETPMDRAASFWSRPSSSKSRMASRPSTGSSITPLAGASLGPKRRMRGSWRTHLQWGGRGMLPPSYELTLKI